jgi:arsenate reductase
MAEGWARCLKGASIEPFSAGLVAHGLNPRAVQVMAERGVDISGQASKTLASLDGQVFDVIITVCGDAEERCPMFPGRTLRIHRGFDDPPKLAREARNEDEALNHFRRVRDEIEAYIRTLPEAFG